MSEHVLKKGCCPICDADEITILRAHCNDGWTAALREQTRAQAAEALAADRLEVLRALLAEWDLSAERCSCPWSGTNEETKRQSDALAAARAAAGRASGAGG